MVLHHKNKKRWHNPDDADAPEGIRLGADAADAAASDRIKTDDLIVIECFDWTELVSRLTPAHFRSGFR